MHINMIVCTYLKSLTMVTVFRVKNLRFQIYTHDHIPAHVHVLGHGGECRVNLENLRVISSNGFNSQEIRIINIAVRENLEFLIEQWEKYHGKETQKNE